MTKGIVISLYDFTGEALKPWAEAGYHCFSFDIQHDANGYGESFESGGMIEYIQLDLHNIDNIKHLVRTFKNDFDNVGKLIIYLTKKVTS